MLSTYFLLNVYDFLVQFNHTLRQDLFLIEEAGVYYQRRGIFLSLSFILYSILFSYFLAVNKYYCLTIIRKALAIILVAIYLGNAFLSAYLAQIIGSNNALVCILGSMFATLLFWLMVNSNKLLKSIERKKITISRFFLSKFAVKLSFVVFTCSLLLLVVAIIMIQFFDLDITRWRIMGYGEGELSSLSSRYDLIDNFFIHINYANPLVGNMMVDSLTTGKGTYVHSFPLALLTHLGIIGFVLFVCYLFFSIKEKRSYMSMFMGNSFLIYEFMLFSGFFLIASVGTFINWPVLWFLLGFIFTPISLKKSIHE